MDTDSFNMNGNILMNGHFPPVNAVLLLYNLIG